MVVSRTESFEHGSQGLLKAIVHAGDDERERVAADGLLSLGFSIADFEEYVGSLDIEERSCALQLLFDNARAHSLLEDCIYCEVRARQLQLTEIADFMKQQIISQFTSETSGLSWPGHASGDFPNFEALALAKQNGSWSIMLCRPPYNIMNIQMLKEMKSAFDFLNGQMHHSNWQGMPIVVLTGVGSKAFSTGGEIREHLPDKAEELLDSLHSLFTTILNTDMLTIAKVRGKALGAAFELVVVCDFAIASKDAEFRHPEVERGCFPTVGVALYPLLLDWKTLVEIVYRGRLVSAQEAKELLLISDVVEPEQLNRSVQVLLEDLEARSSPVLKLARIAMFKGPAGKRREEIVRAMHEVERVYLDHLVKVHDMTEGLQAFLDHRMPHFEDK